MLTLNGAMQCRAMLAKDSCQSLDMDTVLQRGTALQFWSVTAEALRGVSHAWVPSTARRLSRRLSLERFHSRSCGDSDPLPHGSALGDDSCTWAGSGSPGPLRLPPTTPQGLVPGHVCEGCARKALNPT